MQDEKTVRAEHLVRFNMFDAGTVRDIPEADFVKWEEMKLVKKAKKGAKVSTPLPDAEITYSPIPPDSSPANED